MTAPDHKAVSEFDCGAGVNVVLANLRAHYPQDGAVLDGYIRRLEAAVIAHVGELEKLRQRCEELEADAATERALQRAAKELPEGWIVRVEVERGAGWVDLHDPSGAFSVQGMIEADDTLAAAIYRAIDRAGGGES